jgi:hypothetical protein
MLGSLDHAIERTSTRRGSSQDPNMTTNEQISAEIRQHLNQVIDILQPYAMSSRSIKNRKTLETAIGLAQFYLSRAARIADKLKRTTS